MPHQCTNCGKLFPDGSKEMLSGCPNCGGNKFQFRPSGSDEGAIVTDDSGGGPSPPSAGRGEPSPQSTGAAESKTTVRDWVRKRAPSRLSNDAASAGVDDTPESQSASATEGQPPEAAEGQSADAAPPRSADTARSPGERTVDSSLDERGASEDTAQASARSDVVTPSELAQAADHSADSADANAPPTDAEGRVIEPTSDERPGLEDLREELNNQFESIKVINPGQYELNLMELYDRDEYIISLQEDGRYVIEVPDAWNASDEDE